MPTLSTRQTPADFGTHFAGLWRGAADWTQSHSNEILIACVTGAVIVAALMGVKQFGVWLCGRRTPLSKWPEVIGNTLRRTRLWFMVAVAAQTIIWVGKAPAEIAQPVHMIFIVASCLQVAIWVRSLIIGSVEARAGEADPQGNLNSAVGLIRLLVTVTIIVLAVIVILANLGVDVTGLVAGLGIGGIAIGLAAQGIFSDLFAALSILFDKPFRRGDTIRYDQTTGTVEYIGLKSSRIRAVSGEEIIISNANLLSKELRNFARVETRRITQTLSLVCQTPAETCAAIEEILRPAIDACEGANFVRCGLESFAPSSLDFTLMYDIDADDQALVLARRHAVNIAVLRAFADQGISFAYPTQTTFTAAPDGTLVMPYAPPPKA